MIRSLFALMLAGLVAAVADAHFVYIVPVQGGQAATVVFSDDLNPDDAVEIAKVAGLKLTVRDLAGKDLPVDSKADKHSLAATLPGAGARIVFGSIPYGVMQRGDAKPSLLVYHPKALVGSFPWDKSAIGAAAPAELVPVKDGGKLRFKLVAGGKPVADAEVNVLKPDGTKTKVKTGADGRTEAVDGTGRFAAWARVAEAKAGEHAGKKYDDVRHYATLVVDVAAN